MKPRFKPGDRLDPTWKPSQPLFLIVVEVDYEAENYIVEYWKQDEGGVWYLKRPRGVISIFSIDASYMRSLNGVDAMVRIV